MDFSIARGQAVLSTLYQELNAIAPDPSPEADRRRWLLRSYISTLQVAIETALLSTPLPTGWWTPVEE